MFDEYIIGPGVELWDDKSVKEATLSSVKEATLSRVI